MIKVLVNLLNLHYLHFVIPYGKLTANTSNTIFIPTLNIGEGEFLIKSYWNIMLIRY
jgi:hypothetical protein